MRQRTKKIIVIGYGNPGRLDDGLGPAFADAIEKMNLSNVSVDSAYQLTVEDASFIADYDIALFADADVNCPEPFYLRKAGKEPKTSFSTHVIEPETVMSLAKRLFGSDVEGYVMGIRGYDFNEFGEKLSKGAKKNLALAVEYIKPMLVNASFDKMESITQKVSVTRFARSSNGDK
jgi:hydrogenase maturation protease